MSDEQIRIPSLAELATIAWAGMQASKHPPASPQALANEAIARALAFRKILEQRCGT